MKFHPMLFAVAVGASACVGPTASESSTPTTQPADALAFSEPETAVPEATSTIAPTTVAPVSMSDDACPTVVPALNALGSLQALGPDDAATRVEASFAVLNEELRRLAADAPSSLGEHAAVLQATYAQLTELWASRNWDYRTVLADPVIAADLEMLSTWRVTVAQEALTEWVPKNCVA